MNKLVLPCLHSAEHLQTIRGRDNDSTVSCNPLRSVENVQAGILAHLQKLYIGN